SPNWRQKPTLFGPPPSSLSRVLGAHTARVPICELPGFAIGTRAACAPSAKLESSSADNHPCLRSNRRGSVRKYPSRRYPQSLPRCASPTRESRAFHRRERLSLLHLSRT